MLAAGVATFLLVASVVEPRSSSARDILAPGVIDTLPQRGEQVAAAMARRDHPRGWPLLGMLEGTDYLLLIYGSPSGARYTVCSRVGEVLERDLPPADVYRSFPDLDVPGMRLDPADTGGPGTPLMLAEPLN
jgi:hypothetical protein